MISINSNVLNLKLQNNIFKSMFSLQNTLQRMMTGLKINSAADDPAGLYIANKFYTQIRGLETANNNIQSALNLLGMTDNSIKEINDIMAEIRDLVQKSANGYLTPAEREANQQKVNELYAQAQAIKNNTEFNGNKLFANSTILDKNTTYTDEQPTALMSRGGGSSTTFTPVTTAAGMTLNRIGDVPEETTTTTTTSTTSTPTDGGEAAEEPTAAVMMMSFDDEETGTEPEAAAPMMMRTMSMRSAPTPEDWGTEGTYTFAAGETKTVMIDGKTYTIENTSGQTRKITYSTNADGFIAFSGDHSDTSSLIITAADGQDDKILLGTHTLTLNTGDGCDIVTLDGAYGNIINTGVHNDTVTIKGVHQENDNTINTGYGNDTVILENNAFDNTIDGGAGTDNIIDNSNNTHSYNTIINFENTGSGAEDWGTEGTYTFAEGETKTVAINNMIYTITCDSNYGGGILTYSTDENGQIKFKGDCFTITAAKEQDDKIIIDGHHNNIYTADGDDKVIISARTKLDGNVNGANSVDGGDGTDTIINNSGITSTTITNFEIVPEDWGTSGRKTFSSGETKTAMINGLVYTITNNDSYSKSFEFSRDADGVITFNCASGNFNITAADGQEDKIVIIDNYGTLNTGDGNDTVDVSGSNGTVITGDGDDTVNLLLSGINTINTGAGDDTVTISSEVWAENTIDGGEGTDTIIDNSNRSNTITNFENTGSGATGSAVEDWGTSGSKTIAAGETITVMIDGKTYTIENTSGQTRKITYSTNADGFIAFSGAHSDTSSLIITAADGQDDKILLGTHTLTLNTGDGCDIVTLDGAYGNIINTSVHNDTVTIKGVHQENANTINTGYGNDTVILENDAFDNTIDGGDGTDTIIDNSNNTHSYNTIINFENGDVPEVPEEPEIEDWGTSGAKTFAAGETKTVKINGLTYTIENVVDYDNYLEYYTNVNGQITFNSAFFTITAADGQDDNILIDGFHGHHLTIYTQDGNDTVTLGYHTTGHNFVDGGTGTDTIIDNSSYPSSNTITNFENTGSGATGSAVEDWGTSGAKTFAAGETKTVKINGLTYTIENVVDYDNYLEYYTNVNGQITFNSAFFTITAADGQDDNILIDGFHGHHLTIYTQDGNDTVTLGYHTIGHNFVDGGYHTDTIIDNSNNTHSYNTIINFENGDVPEVPEEPEIEDWGTEGTYTFAAGESKTVKINGLTYTIENVVDYDNYLEYYTDVNGQITFNSAFFTITAADGQDDNILIDGFHGHHLTIYTQDGNDTVTLGYHTIGHNFVDGGYHTDTIIDNSNNTHSYNTIINFENGDVPEVPEEPEIEDWGTDGTKTLAAGEEKTVVINGLTYTIKNDKTSSNSITFSTDADGQITFSGLNFTITAADEQDDNIKLDGNLTTLNTGDGNDNIVVTKNGNNVNSGTGDDTVTLNSGVSNVRANGGDGTDTLINNSTGSNTITNFEIADSGTREFSAGETVTLTIDGKQYTVKNENSSNSTLRWSLNEDGQITFSCNRFAITAADGQEDNIKINGDYNTVDTGDSDDIIYAYNSSHGTIIAGDGDDTVNLNGAGSNTINGGNGYDTLINDINNRNNTISNFENTNHHGTREFTAGESVTLTIDGKSYTVVNNNSTSAEFEWISYGANGIGFKADNFTVTAANGQDDNVIWGVDNGTLNTGDGDDTVKFTDYNWNVSNSTVNTGSGNDNVIINNEGENNTINTGADNDTVTIDENYSENNIIDGGNGTDTITINNPATNSTNSYINFENVGQYNFAAGETITLNIDGKQYTVKNEETSARTLEWTINADGQIEFNSDSEANFTITAGDGQEDNIKMNLGGTLNTGDGADVIYVSSNGVTVNAGDGADNITIGYGATSSTINAGDGTDIITIDSRNATVNAGAGNDIIYMSSAGINCTIDGGTGNNALNITEKGNVTSTTITNFKTINSSNYTQADYNFAAGETITLNIDGKTYTVTNSNDSEAILRWDSYPNNINNNGMTVFDGNNFTITAANGQDDNIYIDGQNITLNTGDGDDTVNVQSSNSSINTDDGNDNVSVVGSNNTINTGDGNDNATVYNRYTSNNFVDGGNGTDTITINEPNTNSTNSYVNFENAGQYNFDAGETVTLTIDGKTYTVKNEETSAYTLNWTINADGQIEFNSDSEANFTITAGNGQEDNIKMSVGGTLNTDDGNDKIHISSSNVTVNAGGGNDDITIDNNANNATINAGAGDDTVNVSNGSATIDGGSGNNIYNVTENIDATNNTVTNFKTINSTKEANASYEFKAGETVILNIDGNSYTVTNKNNTNATLSWDNFSSNNEFFGEGFSITAADGQIDNIIFNGNYNTINTGDNDDYVDINGSNNIIFAGTGSDFIGNNGNENIIDSGTGSDFILTSGTNNIINGGDGNDEIQIDTGANNNIISGGNGSDTITESNNNGIYQNGQMEIFAAGETKTININGNSYTIKNTENNTQDNTNAIIWEINNDGKITFHGNNFSITAANGQEDNVEINGYNNKLDTKDGADTVIVGSKADSNEIKTGDGDDKVIVNESASNNEVYGGNGNNTLINNSGNNTNNFYNFGAQEQTFNPGETKEIIVGDKVYTITNTSDAQNTVSWVTDDNGQTTFTGDEFHITAKNNQEDNIKIIGSGWHLIDTGDRNDTVIIEGDENRVLAGSGDDNVTINSGINSTIYSGSGNDTITNNGTNTEIASEGNVTITNNGSADGININGGVIYNNGAIDYIHGHHTSTTGNVTLHQNSTTETLIEGVDKVVSVNNDSKFTITNGSSVQVEIDGKEYTFENVSGHHSSVHIDKTDAGAIKIEADGLNVTAKDNQKDNIHWAVTNGTLDTGNLDDTIYVSSTGTIIAGDGNDSITVGQYANNSTIQGGTGNDNISVNSNGSFIYGGADNDSIFISGNENEIYGEAGNDTININGNENWIEAGAGDDYTSILKGSDNYADGGSTGYDKIANRGTGTTYTGMNELTDRNTAYTIQVGADNDASSTFGISAGTLLPEFKIDLSSRESALNALNQIDSIMLGLTSSRVEIQFQQSMLDSIMKNNLTKITNFKTSQSTIMDADVAQEYNKLIEEASRLESLQLLQTQLQQNKANVFLSLIQSIGA